MSAVTCPHCSAENPEVSSFCESCGKALASPGGGPVVFHQNALPHSSAGRSLLSQELQAETRKASGALLAVAILQVAFGTLLLVVGRFGNIVVPLTPFVFVVVYGIGIAFFCLFLWARKSPLPAAIVGLVLFVTVHLLDAVTDPTALFRGILVKIIIVVVLAKAVGAGVRYRKLLERGAAG